MNELLDYFIINSSIPSEIESQLSDIIVKKSWLKESALQKRILNLLALTAAKELLK